MSRLPDEISYAVHNVQYCWAGEAGCDQCQRVAKLMKVKVPERQVARSKHVTIYQGPPGEHEPECRFSKFCMSDTCTGCRDLRASVLRGIKLGLCRAVEIAQGPGYLMFLTKEAVARPKQTERDAKVREQARLEVAKKIQVEI